MTEPATEEVEQPQEGEQSTEELSPEALRKELEKARKEAASYRTKFRDAAPAAQRLAELEEAQKSESQKLSERAEKAEREAANYQHELARLRVLAEISLPADLHEFVTGSDEKELRAKAQKLKAQFGADNRSVDVGQGPRGTAPVSGMSERIRQAAGRA